MCLSFSTSPSPPHVGCCVLCAGVLLFGRTPEAAKRFTASMMSRELSKRYIARVRGVFPALPAAIDSHSDAPSTMFRTTSPHVTLSWVSVRQGVDDFDATARQCLWDPSACRFRRATVSVARRLLLRAEALAANMEVLPGQLRLALRRRCRCP